ncbi:hypothetical protein CC80DRAFT_548450 [Byssothecium circinans]|uniref:Fungal N-terminal domain-containing protein n=1 Tax=Byssothecium circinans TaxID=147558 RepID=A0A6A5TU17_9PLEO|nr:hypothetical protein CC80DRAFT_548450 [Byssothecium circinans]
MDPVTIFQIVSAAASMSDMVLRCITRLSSLKAKYHDAPIHISAMIGQLYMVQAALDQLSVWNRAEYSGDARYRQLASQIGNSLDCFGLLVLALQKQLDRFESSGLVDMAARGRVRFLWSEKEMGEYSVLLDRQVNALSLLLQAVQCQTWTQQQSYMCREESRSVLALAKDCSSSILGLDDTLSFVTETTTDISVMFDFDNVILASRIYQQAERSHLRQAIRAGNGHKGGESLSDAIGGEDNDTTMSIRNHMAGETSDKRTEREFYDSHGKDGLARTRSLNRKSPAAQNARKKPPERPNELFKDALAATYSTKPVRPARSSWQPSNSRLNHWWKKSPRRKDNPDQPTHEKESSRNVLIPGTSESRKSTLLKALYSTRTEMLQHSARLTLQHQTTLYA